MRTFLITGVKTRQSWARMRTSPITAVKTSTSESRFRGSAFRDPVH
jgi:hypothetical protein